MNIVWNLVEEDKSTKIRLHYNVYLGIKKLFVDTNKVLDKVSFKRNQDITFQYNGKDYKVELVGEGYDYKGYLVTPEGERVPSEDLEKPYKRAPLWVIPFIIANLIIPIIATEALFTWIVGVAGAIVSTKVSKSDKLSTWKKIAICMAILVLAWLLYYVFFYFVTKYNMLASNDGFFPRHKK